MMYLVIDDNPATLAKAMEVCNEAARREGRKIPETEKDLVRGSRCNIPFAKMLCTNYTDYVTHKDFPKRKAIRIDDAIQKHDGLDFGGYRFEVKNCVDKIDGWTEVEAAALEGIPR